MQFVPQRRDLEQALLKAKPPVYTVPSGRSLEEQQIHDIFVNTPIPPESFETQKPKPKQEEKPAQQSPRKPRDLQAELRALNLVPNVNEGPKRGTGTYHPQEDNFDGGMPIFPGRPMPGFPGRPGNPAFPGMPRPMPFNRPGNLARQQNNQPNNMDPNNYDDYQDFEDENHEEEENQNEEDGDNN